MHGKTDDVVEVLAALKNSDAKKKTRGASGSKSKTEKDLKNVKCFKCAEKEHYPRDCPKKKQNGSECETGSQKFVLVATVDECAVVTQEMRAGISTEQARKLLEVDK